MRILVVMPLGVRRGGAETALLHLLSANRSQPQAEYAVVFLSKGSMVSAVSAMGYRTWELDAGRLREPSRFVAAVKSLRRVIVEWKPDVVLGWMAKAQIYVAAATVFMNVPMVWWQWGIPSNGWMDRVVTALPARLILCCSKTSANAQVRIKPRRYTAVVYPPVDIQRLAQLAARTTDSVRAQLGLAPEKPLVGIVARLERWKGIHVFLEAAAILAQQIADLQFAVVGGEHFSDPLLPKELRSQALQLGIGDRVIFTGHQENPEDWMHAMDVVVHASVTPEPFGMVMIEAMALGRPVVAPALGGPLEIITHGHDGLLYPAGDPSALAQVVKQLLTDKALRCQIVEAAALTVQKYDSRRFADEILARCQEACEKAQLF